MISEKLLFLQFDFWIIVDIEVWIGYLPDNQLLLGKLNSNKQRIRFYILFSNISYISCR